MGFEILEEIEVPLAAHVATDGRSGKSPMNTTGMTDLKLCCR